MITVHPIVIFLAGFFVALSFIGGYLTGWYFRGKRISVSMGTHMGQKVPRVKPGVPPADTDEFNRMIAMINAADDKQTYANELRENTIRDRF